MEDKPIFSIFNLLRQAYGLNKERVKFYGLNDLETITLINIGMLERPTQKEICEKLKAPKQTINNIIKNLEDKGHVRLVKDKDDKRVRILKLTEAGLKNRDEHLKPLMDANDRMYENLGKDETSEIEKSLRLLISAIRKNYERED